MTADEGRLQPIVEAVANGSAIDWSARFAAADAEEKERLGALRAIADIAGFHRDRTSDNSTGSLGDALSAHAQLHVDPHARPDLSHGVPWGPLIVLEQVDGGSFGDVFKAWDPALAKVVALKRTRYATAADAARAVSEAQRLASIPPHPNVITVHGACNIDGVVGIWMEFLRGRTLRQVVEDQGELGPVEATHYGECLCRALAHAHNAMVLHRDVKAANVMKAAGGRIVLIDFGSGDEIAPLGARTNNRLVGTLPYMAPELFRGQAASPQSDIYSLGVLLFNLVTGGYPVTGHSRDDFARAHERGRPALLSDVRSDLPLDFVRVVERAIAPDPAKRYRTAGEFLHGLVPQAVPQIGNASTKSIATEWANRLIWSAILIGSVLTALGAVSSRFFNSLLGRSEFANESVGDWLYWGGRSIFAPGLLCLFALALMALCTEGGALLVAKSTRAQSITHLLKRGGRRLQLHDLSVVSCCALFGSSLALGVVWWYFFVHTPTFANFSAINPDISRVPAAKLAFLAPRFWVVDDSPDHVWYRESLTAVIVLCVILWYPAIRLAMATGEAINHGVAIGGAAVLLLSLLLLEIPYRLIAAIDARQFPEVNWQGAKCFNLGEQSMLLLLYCPDMHPDRNIRVPKNHENLKELAPRTDIFANVETLR